MVLLKGFVTYAGLGKNQCISDLKSNQKVGNHYIYLFLNWTKRPFSFWMQWLWVQNLSLRHLSYQENSGVYYRIYHFYRLHLYLPNFYLLATLKLSTHFAWLNHEKFRCDFYWQTSLKNFNINLFCKLIDVWQPCFHLSSCVFLNSNSWM